MKNCLLLIAALLLSTLAHAQAPFIPVTFAWDTSSTVGTVENPIKYNLCSTSIAPANWPAGGFPPDRAARNAGTALELQMGIVVGTFYFFATAYYYGMTVDGVLDTTKTLESGPSNVLKIVVFAPPGNPSKVRIKSVTNAMGSTSGQTIKAAY